MAQVRQFPDGAEAGLSKATAYMESGEWEKNLEGLELIVSLARGHAEVSYIIGKLRPTVSKIVVSFHREGGGGN